MQATCNTSEMLKCLLLMCLTIQDNNCDWLLEAKTNLILCLTFFLQTV